jgi:outer membrane lipoprotein-sorting protein
MNIFRWLDRSWPAFIILFAGKLALADDFEKIKKQYDSAAMVILEVDIMVESKIFNETDSSRGYIAVTEDGRYITEINNDVYLFDGNCKWEYSAENNQVTKRCPEDDETVDNRLAFIKNLDEYYKTDTIYVDSVYRLTKTGEDDESLPDTLLIYLRESRLSTIEYLDLNDDMNRVIISKQIVSDSVDADRFRINLPDSVEIITLP